MCIFKQYSYSLPFKKRTKIMVRMSFLFRSQWAEVRIPIASRATTNRSSHKGSLLLIWICNQLAAKIERQNKKNGVYFIVVTMYLPIHPWQEFSRIRLTDTFSVTVLFYSLVLFQTKHVVSVIQLHSSINSWR